jgi:hypothetical protein
MNGLAAGMSMSMSFSHNMNLPERFNPPDDKLRKSP